MTFCSVQFKGFNLNPRKYLLFYLKVIIFDIVVKYVFNQPKHHKKQSFKEKYLLLLEKFEVN